MHVKIYSHIPLVAVYHTFLLKFFSAVFFFFSNWIFLLFCQFDRDFALNWEISDEIMRVGKLAYMQKCKLCV